jgi:hypothetical protein
MGQRRHGHYPIQFSSIDPVTATTFTHITGTKLLQKEEAPTQHNHQNRVQGNILKCYYPASYWLPLVAHSIEPTRETH